MAEKYRIYVDSYTCPSWDCVFPYRADANQIMIYIWGVHLDPSKTYTCDTVTAQVYGYSTSNTFYSSASVSLNFKVALREGGIKLYASISQTLGNYGSILLTSDLNIYAS